MTDIHNIFKGKLIKIDSKPDQKTGQINHRLIFKSQRFDRGLEEMVDCSQPVKLDLEHHHLLEFYKCYIGKEIYVPVVLSAMDANVFYRTGGDGKALQLEEKIMTTQESEYLKTLYESES